jgi:hypothetical protein
MGAQIVSNYKKQSGFFLSASLKRIVFQGKLTEREGFVRLSPSFAKIEENTQCSNIKTLLTNVLITLKPIVK